MRSDIKSLLLFAREMKGIELYLAADAPIEILVGSERSKLNLPSIETAEFDALLRQHLDERECGILESTGSVSSLFELKDVGLVRARIVGRNATYILPMPDLSIRETGVTGLARFRIDCQLKPLNTRLVSSAFFFSKLFPLPFLLIGSVVLYFSCGNLIQAYASMNWPSALGTIRQSVVKASRNSEVSVGSRTKYSADVSYRFAVNGISFDGDRVDFGSAGSNGSSDRSYAEGMVIAYPRGREVRVYYAPENPDESVLEPGIKPVTLLGPLAALVFLLTGLAMLIFLPKLMRRRNQRII